MAESTFARLRRKSPRVTGGLVRMREASYADGAIPGKYKVLTALAISVAIRCEPCIKAYVDMARNRGVTEDELIEFLNVAMTMQGCPGEEWALKAYRHYLGEDGASMSEDDATVATEESCCAVPEPTH